MTSGTELSIESLVCGPLGNNVYVVSRGEHALVIDVPLESTERITSLLERRGLRLEGIVLSHGHFDHMAETAELVRKTGAPVLVHAGDAERVRVPPRPMMFPQLEIEPAPVDRRLGEGDAVSVGDVSLTVLHTPGHTPGSMCLYSEAAGVLLSGDTLFAGSFGRYDLPGGDPRVLRDSLVRLSALPAGTRVLPGHGAETTIGSEGWLKRPPL
jgi:hydroxyacylglutathione hydrolase